MTKLNDEFVPKYEEFRSKISSKRRPKQLLSDRKKLTSKLNKFEEEDHPNFTLDDKILFVRICCEFAKRLFGEMWNSFNAEERNRPTKIFCDYIEAALAIIKHAHFEPNNQTNIDLINIIQNFQPDQQTNILNDNIYLPLRQRYFTVEQSVIDNNLVMLGGDDCARFRTKQSAANHYYRHSVQDRFETILPGTNLTLKRGGDIIDPARYLAEAHYAIENDFPSYDSDDEEKDQGFYLRTDSLYGPDQLYEAHYRLSVSNSETNELITYFKHLDQMKEMPKKKRQKRL